MLPTSAMTAVSENTHIEVKRGVDGADIVRVRNGPIIEDGVCSSTYASRAQHAARCVAIKTAACAFRLRSRAHTMRAMQACRRRGSQHSRPPPTACAMHAHVQFP